MTTWYCWITICLSNTSVNMIAHDSIHFYKSVCSRFINVGINKQEYKFCIFWIWESNTALTCCFRRLSPWRRSSSHQGYHMKCTYTLDVRMPSWTLRRRPSRGRREWVWLTRTRKLLTWPGLASLLGWAVSSDLLEPHSCAWLRLCVESGCHEYNVLSCVIMCGVRGAMNKMFRSRLLYPDHTNGLGCTVLWIWLFSAVYGWTVVSFYDFCASMRIVQ